jgi:hypothetical protein
MMFKYWRSADYLMQLGRRFADEGGKLFKSSLFKLLITNSAFCIVQRATAQSKTGIFMP